MKKATLCYILHDDKVLMLYRDRTKDDLNKGFHLGVGGKKEEGESFLECVIRETAGETGYTIHNPRARGCLLIQNEQGDDWTVVVYTATHYEGEEQESTEGKLRWMEKDAILTLPLLEGDKLWLPHLFGERFFVAQLDYRVEGEQRHYTGGAIQLF